MRAGIVVEVTAADRARPEAVVANRDSPRERAWRARIVLPTADGCGTAGLVRRAGRAETAVRRWRERFLQAGAEGPPRDRTRP